MPFDIPKLDIPEFLTFLLAVMLVVLWVNHKMFNHKVPRRHRSRHR